MTSFTPRLPILALTAFALLACGRPATQSDVVARVGGGTLTVADLDAYLLAQPPAARQVPAGADAEKWLEGKVRRLALERVLADETSALDDAAESEARRLLLRARLLAPALMRQLAQEAAPSDEEVAAKAEELAGRQRPEPVLDFQHVFFRTDRGDPAAARERAEQVAAEAGDDADFTALAREHSDSADAEEGGLVRNARPRDLDEKTRATLAALGEGEVSPLVTSRTGLHLFRLVRRLEPEPPSAAQLESTARNGLQQENLRAGREALLAEVRGRIEVETGQPPWRIGDTTIRADVLEHLLPAGAGEVRHEALVEQLLLAEEAAARDLDTPEVERQVAAAERLARLERVFNERRRASDAELGDDVLRPYYDAQPSLFDTRETARVGMIFVPQGRDSFATQKRVEGVVARLRAGADFAETARKISEHPSADDGGDLGLVDERQLTRYGPEIAAAAVDLQPGEVSDPIYVTGRVLSSDPQLLRGGFAVLRLVERVPSRPRSFEEARDDVRRVYAAQHRGELDLQLQDQILAAAGFELVRLPEPGELAL